MKKLGVYFVVAMLMVSFAFMGTGIRVYAAEVGDQVLEPESGWKRYDNTDSRIIYEDGWENATSPDYYNETLSLNRNSINKKMKFKFWGDKIRLLGNTPYEGSLLFANNVKYTIDGKTYDAISPNEFKTDVRSDKNYKVVLVDVQNLENKEHYFEFYGEDPNTICIDAIDIDEEGELLNPYTLVNLTAIEGNAEINLSWDVAVDAESYVVKRATTSGGSYTTIAENILGTSYTDTDVVNDTTYYYVVCAVINGAESTNSNEVSATLEAPVANNALLKITMINGTINEYDLSMTDVDDFIDWFEDRDDPYYIIEKDYNIGLFESRKDYIVADKILQFEVMEYNK